MIRNALCALTVALTLTACSSPTEPTAAGTEEPAANLYRKDIKHLITKGLSQKERLILILYYYEEMTMKEIGMALDLSESRVSQMHSSILLRLQQQLKRRRVELAD